ncbi:MAG TPA: hypothetical protein VM142_04405 [Acidimicrobiales bacterium]|nr:hypothetical protein [Acidimicrobiales bacterium]
MTRSKLSWIGAIAVPFASVALPLLAAHDVTSVENFASVAATATRGYDELTTAASYVYDTSIAARGFRTKMVDASATTSFVADSLGRMTSVTRGGDTFSYGWDRASQLTSLTYPDATAFSYAYDDDAHLGRVSSGGVDIATYAHDPSGRLTTTTRPNAVVTTASWDTAGRLFDIVHSTATATVARASYVLDATNNPTRITDGTGAVATHEYDASDRLVHTCYAGTCAGATDYVDYRYDAVGNRITQTTSDGVTAFSYGPAGQLVGEVGPGGTRAYGYDTSGNLSRAGPIAYTWNKAAQTTSASVGAALSLMGPSGLTSFSYDGDGRRISATNGATSTALVHDPLSAILALEEVGATVSRRYAWGEEAISVSAPGATSSYHLDALGSILATTDAAGAVARAYSWAPYGTPRAATATAGAPANPLRWAGGYVDEPTGDYHFGHGGDYSPATATHHSPRLGDASRLGSPDGLTSAGAYRSLAAPAYALAGANPQRFSLPLAIAPQVPQPASVKGSDPLAPLNTALGMNSGAPRSIGPAGDAAATGLRISAQRQAGHVAGTPQFANRIKQGVPTSVWEPGAHVDGLSRYAWQHGTPVPGRPNVRDLDFGFRIGSGPSGGWQSRVRVHMDQQGRWSVRAVAERRRFRPVDPRRERCNRTRE